MTNEGEARAGARGGIQNSECLIENGKRGVGLGIRIRIRIRSGGGVVVDDLGGVFLGGEVGEGEEVLGGESLGDGVFGLGDFVEGVDGGFGVLVGEVVGFDLLDLVLELEVELAGVGTEEVVEVLFGALEILAELIHRGCRVGDEVEEVVEIGEAVERVGGNGHGFHGWTRIFGF